MPFFYLPTCRTGEAQGAGGPGGTREAGKEGKRERRVRGFDSPPWLVLGWGEEAAPRWPAGGGSYGGGGSAVGSGRGAGGGGRGCGSEGDAEDPFIGRERRWRGGRRWPAIALRTGSNGGWGRHGVMEAMAHSGCEEEACRGR